MKEKVLEFLKGEGLPQERYNEAMSLYRKSENKSEPLANYYNRAGFTDQNFKNICYDLQQLHGISDAEIVRKKSPVVVAAKKEDADKAKKAAEAAKVAALKAAENLKLLLAFNPEETNYNDAKKLVLGMKLDVPDMKKVTIYPALEALKKVQIEKAALKEGNEDTQGAKDISVDVNDAADFDVHTDEITTDKVETTIFPSIPELIEKADDAAKSGFKIREKFPWLAEEDCPDAFKILVADMFTAWDKYKATHEKLLMVGDDNGVLEDSDIYAIAKEAIDAFEVNHAIWDELNYYNEYKEILGNHAIFADEMLKTAVAVMNEADVVKRRNNLRTYISRETKKLKPDTAEAAAKKIKDKIQKYNQELNLLNTRLGE